MTALKLYQEASKRGLRLEPRENKLAVIRAELCPADFADLLREHECALLERLSATKEGRPSNSNPWVYTARQILAREFDIAGQLTRETLVIGPPLCRPSSLSTGA
jgi:hypothetical protein